MSLNIPNLDRLISHMEEIRPDQFDMRFLFRNSNGEAHFINHYAAVVDIHQCGTAACIAGECGILSEAPVGSLWTTDMAAAWLGLPDALERLTFTPPSYHEKDRYPLSRALRMLKHLRAEHLRTGTVVVDWDAPEAVETPRKPWEPPVVIGADRPLPSSLTSLLREPEASAPSISAEG